MSDIEEITRDDLIARLGVAYGLLSAIFAINDELNWSADESIKEFINSAWKPSQHAGKGAST